MKVICEKCKSKFVLFDKVKERYEKDSLCSNCRTKAINIKLVFEVDNGVTLCKTCHQTTYGKEEDFVEIFLTKEQIKNLQGVVQSG